MQILNNLFLVNKQKLINNITQKTLIDKQLNFILSSKLLKTVNKNIITYSVSKDLIYPCEFYKKKGSYLTLKQIYGNTVLYSPFLKKFIKQIFFYKRFKILLLKKNIVKINSCLINIASKKNNINNQQFLVNEAKPKNLKDDITNSLSSYIRIGILGIKVKFITTFIKTSVGLVGSNLNYKTDKKLTKRIRRFIGKRINVPIKNINLKNNVLKVKQCFKKCPYTTLFLKTANQLKTDTILT